MELIELSVVSNRINTLWLAHFFGQACYFTSMSKSVCALENAQCNVLDMPRIDLVEFYFLLYLYFVGDICLQANSKDLESMDRRSLP